MERLQEYFSLPLENPMLIFAVVLTIILFSPLIFNKIKIPHIVGLIVAGIILGPFGINLLNHDASFKLFGQVGVLYIMFLAGIEIDLKDFKKNRTKSITFGLFTFIIPMIIGTITGFFLLYHIYDVLTASQDITWVQGAATNNAFYSFCKTTIDNTLCTNSNITLIKYSALAAIVLASMYASNTLLAYPIVTKLGISKNRSVNITVGGTMVTTILALTVLAVILEMCRGEIDVIFWIRFTISLGIYAFIMFYLIPKLSRWFFKNYDDNVLQYIYVLAIVFLASFLAELAGIEAIIGAFLAGISLNKLVPKRSPLMNRIDFVGNAIFIPFFLISVGMVINMRVLFDSYMIILTAIVMSVAATLSKYLAAKLTQGVFKMSSDEGGMIFGLSNAQAAATLAAVTIAYNLVLGEYTDASGAVQKLRLLPEEILNGTVFMILITCTISSILTEKYGRRLALKSEKEEVENKEQQSETRILLPLSNPDTLDSLVELAVVMHNKNDESPIYALNVVDDNDINSEKAIQGRKLLDKAAQIASGSEHKVKRISRYDLNTASGICNVVIEKSITDLIVGLHRKANLTDSFFGKMTDALLNGVNRMICIYKSTQPIGTIKRIFIVVPKQAEFEDGFDGWCQRTMILAQQIDAEVIFYANKQSAERIEAHYKKNKCNIKPKFEEFEEWEDFLIIAKFLNIDDLLIIVSARKTSISYHQHFEKLPNLLTKYFADNSFMVLYPEQFKDKYK